MDPTSPRAVPPQPQALAEQERACVRRMVDGDPDALRELYGRYARRVQGIALHLLRDAGEAEDLVQETFVEVWRRRGEFDAARGAVGAWILMMARSRSLTRLRARTSALARERVAAGDLAEPQEPLGPRQVEAREVQRQVGGALSLLPDEQRRALELAYYEGLSQTEIAARTGEPLGTVKTRMRRGIQQLAGLLRGAGRDVE